MKSAQLAAHLSKVAIPLAEKATALYYRRYANTGFPSDSRSRKKSERDLGYLLAYTGEAVLRNDPELLANYLGWSRSLFLGLGFPEDVVTRSIAVVMEALDGILDPADAASLTEFLERALKSYHISKNRPTPLFMEEHLPLAGLARDYLSALLRGDRHTAGNLILQTVESGTEVRDVYLHVFQRTQYEIGRLWQTNRVSVAQEHYCTAATQMIMAQLYPKIFRTERVGRTFVATTVGGELHEIGIRMVADFFEMEGWDTYFLGANTPIDSLVRTLEERKADVVGISTTITYHVREVEQAILAIRASAIGTRVKILVGGYPFRISEGLWSAIGADGFAPDARNVVRIAETLLGSSLVDAEV